MRLMKGIASVTVVLLLCAASSATARGADQATTIKGYVIDSACAITKNLKKPISTECAVSCAKAGSPLVILTDAGLIYWPIADEMPAKSQNDKLMDFAGKKVSVTGKVYTKGGSHAIVIAKVEAAPAAKRGWCGRAKGLKSYQQVRDGRILRMEPIFLRDIERTAKATPAGEQLAAMEAQGLPVPQIRYLFT